uniref:Uncharacterized protein n=1 Tax=Caenorhabditis japonica TaxID=281687 RepID=A0A8R1E3Y6_CAEJA
MISNRRTAAYSVEERQYYLEFMRLTKCSVVETYNFFYQKDGTCPDQKTLRRWKRRYSPYQCQVEVVSTSVSPAIETSVEPQSLLPDIEPIPDIRTLLIQLLNIDMAHSHFESSALMPSHSQISITPPITVVTSIVGSPQLSPVQ